MRLALSLIALLASPLAGATTQVTSSPADYVTTYQLGSEWGKLPVRFYDVDGLNTPLAHLSRATARIRIKVPGVGPATLATAWYAGRFGDEAGSATHLMATNFHVAENMRERDCVYVERDGAKVTVESPVWFELTQHPTLSGQPLECERVVGAWKEIDFALLALREPSPSVEQRLAGTGRNFAWKPSIKRGQELVTVGFGTANNAGSRMMKNEDSDCRVISADDEFRLLRDPDQINPAPYSAWSFAHGCDISHGDSGSAFADRATGALIGLVWTAGTSPAGRPAWLRDSTALLETFATPHDALWTQLAYAVPAGKIQDYLSDLVSGAKRSANQVLIQDFLAQSKNAASSPANAD